MSKYILHLKTQNYTKKIPLSLKGKDDLFNDYLDKGTSEYVHNDYAYSLSVTDEEDKIVHFDRVFVNNEIIDDQKIITGNRASCIFLECFGLVKIEIIIEDVSYVTPNIKVVMKEEAINRSIINMIDYIYDNCDDYLYEEHKNSKSVTGVNPNNNISIDTKLSMLNDIYDVYVKGYGILKYSAQAKLENITRVGDFNELQSVVSNTIDYIVNHPEELEPVDYNSGITVNKQHYQPRKTLVQSVTYSFDIYENQVVVGFLRTVVRDLNELKELVERHKKRNITPYKRDGYVDSSYYIYTRNIKMLNTYLDRIDESVTRFQKLFFEYKKILNVTDYEVISQPKYTNIFRRIMPYNIIFENISKWFNCGNYDLAKSDLLLSFVSISKIYEYFCLLKINRSLIDCGYSMIQGYPYKYPENKYYRNTLYNNTFEFLKNDISVTVYYQPIIYGKISGRDRTNGIGLFRTTSISIKEPSILAIIDDNEPQRGNCYVPDYLIKISKNNHTNYYILDAKHSSVNNIERYQLPYLIFKYLFSISTFPQGKSINGMCILCGKAKSNDSKNLYDIANELSVCLSPQATICQVAGNDVNNNNSLIEYVKQLEKNLES